MERTVLRDKQEAIRQFGLNLSRNRRIHGDSILGTGLVPIQPCNLDKNYKWVIRRGC